MLQNNTAIDGQIISVGKLVVKVQYICSMQEKTNCYWQQQPLQHNITVQTRTIIHSRLNVFGIKNVQDIPKNVCSIIQAKKAIQRYPICMTDADYDYILDKTEVREKNDFERTVSVNSDKEQY